MADPQAALRQWIVEGLKRKGHGSSKELARRIGVGPEVLTRMKNTDGIKETRRIEAHMVPIIAAFLGTPPPGFEAVIDLRCSTCQIPAIHRSRTIREPASMPKGITVNIEKPRQSTLIIGDNNAVTINHGRAGLGQPLTPDQMLQLDSEVNDVAAARGANPQEIWTQLCRALQVADPALIHQDLLAPAEQILARWKGSAIQDVIDSKEA